MPTTTAGRRLAVIPVDKIVTALNVRTDATPDADLIASVKANGILQPPTVTQLDDGTYEIVIGHRRANAAAAAGLTEIEALVVDQALAADTRLVEQLVENDQRRQLTEAERTGGYKQLELFSVSPAQISKRLGVKRDKVDTALKVAGNEHATKALTEHGIGLDHAAAIVEFDHDQAAVKELVAAAETSPATFEHALAKVREKAALAVHKETLHRMLEMSKITRLKDATDYMGVDGYEPIDRYGRPDAITEELTPDDVTDKSILAARVWTGHMNVDGGYRQWARIEYFIRKDAEHGFQRRKSQWEVDRENETTRELTPEEQAARDIRQAEQDAANARRAAREAAAKVRRAWLGEVLQRTKLPDYTQLIAWILTDAYGYEPDPRPVVSLLEYSTEDLDEDAATQLLRDRLNENPKNAARILLAQIVIHVETFMNPSWRSPERIDAVYLTALGSWGYGLSEIETADIERGSTLEDEPEDDADPLDAANDEGDYDDESDE